MQENQPLSSGGLVVKKGYKFPIYPTAEQKVLLEKNRDLNAALNILQEGEKGLAELLLAHPSSTLYLVNSSR